MLLCQWGDGCKLYRRRNSCGGQGCTVGQDRTEVLESQRFLPPAAEWVCLAGGKEPKVTGERKLEAASLSSLLAPGEVGSSSHQT